MIKRKIKFNKGKQKIEDNAENYVDISDKEKSRIKQIIQKSKIKKHSLNREIYNK